jgi:hypothetical protein
MIDQSRKPPSSSSSSAAAGDTDEPSGDIFSLDLVGPLPASELRVVRDVGGRVQRHIVEADEMPVLGREYVRLDEVRAFFDRPLQN